ncbi:MAG: DinB superfamily protein [Bacteroidetes bacterium ADurb.BinA245]|nr:MAG: DinB superfamily protein [Bacteroidetes bacterium ADurb.BinA245]HNC40092.1 DinB family protein [Chitinophagaceae bacterium]
MMIASLISLYKRDLEKLKQELSQYEHENCIWETSGNISNSAGNLCLHLVGNLNTYIGAELGGTNYVRNRPLEFSQKNIPRAELIEMVEATSKLVMDTLQKLKEVDLSKEYPQIVFETKMTTGYFLMHLAVHLGYHLGQINYHRRMLDMC